MLTRDDCHALRRTFEPQMAKLLIVAESPPASGKYFYDPTGVVTEPLFAALMRQLKCLQTSKEEGLRAFQASGWVLVDATYSLVSTLSDRGRDAAIARYYPLLRDDLATLSPDRSAFVLLLKANVLPPPGRAPDERRLPRTQPRAHGILPKQQQTEGLSPAVRSDSGKMSPTVWKLTGVQ